MIYFKNTESQANVDEYRRVQTSVNECIESLDKYRRGQTSVNELKELYV